MLYVIIGQDVPGSLVQRTASRPAHIDRLQLLQRQGRLLLAGPFPAVDAGDPVPTQYTGSLIVAEFATLSDAQAWADADPYRINGVYGEVVVYPFIKTFPS
jgi:hypothetical protein